MATRENRDELPLSEREAKRIAVGLLLEPVAVAVWVAGLFAMANDAGSVPLGIAMGLAFMVNAVVVLMVFGLVIRIAGRSDRSLFGTLFAFNFRIPWSLLVGSLGRKVYERAGFSERLLAVQRTLVFVAFAGGAAWFGFGLWQAFGSR